MFIIFFISAQFFVVQPINDLFTTTTAVKRPIVPLNSEVSRNKRVDRTVVTVSIVKLLLVFMLFIKNKLLNNHKTILCDRKKIQLKYTTSFFFLQNLSSYLLQCYNQHFRITITFKIILKYVSLWNCIHNIYIIKNTFI